MLKALYRTICPRGGVGGTGPGTMILHGAVHVVLHSPMRVCHVPELTCIRKKFCSRLQATVMNVSFTLAASLPICAVWSVAVPQGCQAGLSTSYKTARCTCRAAAVCMQSTMRTANASADSSPQRASPEL